MLASRASTHFPLCFLRIESVCPARVIGLPLPGGVTTTESLAPHKRPLPENLDLLNLACAVKSGPISTRLSPCRSSEVRFPHDRLSRHEKDDIVRHQRQHRLDITRFGCSHPGGDELAYFLFVLFHMRTLSQRLCDFSVA